MLVIKGKNSGFCFGVKRAVAEAENMTGNKNYILGEIIHNELVNHKLKEKGLITIDDVSSVNFSKGDNLLIRTHGEPKQTFDLASNLGVNVVDCTCPFVKEIQKIVFEHYNKGYKIVIIGNPNHPEVKGINGWCENTALISDNSEEISKISDDKICVVVQTTYSEQKFDNIIKNFTFDKEKTLDIFKTICYTTTKRQREAELIAKDTDAVIVIGGANSNNTHELYLICSKFCDNVIKVTDPKAFDYKKIKNFKKVGIVFGASTPIEQFQEVVQEMEKVTEEIVIKEQEEVATQVEAVETAKKSEMEVAFENIKPNKDFRVGQIITAKISSVKDDGLTLSLKNAKKDFELSKDEMLSEFNKDEYKEKIGQDIKVMVVAKNPLKLSEKAMAKILAEEAEIEEIKNGKIFEAVITETNKGGLVGKYGSYQVFVPASQIKLGFVKELDKYVGKTLRLKAEKVESKGARRQIVGSQRVILLAEKEERDAIKAQKEAEFLESIQEGDIVLGTPVRFAAFGAFIDVNGFDCLAHISDLSWTGCKDCSEVLELNKEYEFKILKIDMETKRVSVGFKQLQPKPWDLVAEKYSVGDVIKGKVVRIVSFGAFVEVEKGIDALVHVSQISNKWLENPVTALEVGQEVDAKILEINPEKEKMTISIKALLEPEQPEEPVEVEEKPAKSKKRSSKKTEEDDGELREWKEDTTAGVSIADLLNN